MSSRDQVGVCGTRNPFKGNACTVAKKVNQNSCLTVKHLQRDFYDSGKVKQQYLHEYCKIKEEEKDSSSFKKKKKKY